MKTSGSLVLDKLHRNDKAKEPRPEAAVANVDAAEDAAGQHEDHHAADRMAQVAIGNGAPVAKKKKVGGFNVGVRGKPPSAEASRDAMNDFREVNGDVGRGKPPGPDAMRDVMQDFREVNGDVGRGSPPSPEASREAMNDFREVNGDVGRGAPPSPEASREVNGDVGRGRPPGADAMRDVMQDF